MKQDQKGPSQSNHLPIAASITVFIGKGLADHRNILPQQDSLRRVLLLALMPKLKEFATVADTPAGHLVGVPLPIAAAALSQRGP